MEVCEFVNFSMAKKLKEKGFNLHCMSFYALENFIDECVDSCGDCYEVDFEKDILYLNYPLHYKKFEEKMLPAPTISQVLKWLREVHNVYIDIGIYVITKDMLKYNTNVYHNKNRKDSMYSGIHLTKECSKYEEACVVALKYVLDNLI